MFGLLATIPGFLETRMVIFVCFLVRGPMLGVAGDAAQAWEIKRQSTKKLRVTLRIKEEHLV